MFSCLTIMRAVHKIEAYSLNGTEYLSCTLWLHLDLPFLFIFLCPFMWWLESTHKQIQMIGFMLSPRILMLDLLVIYIYILVSSWLFFMQSHHLPLFLSLSHFSFNCDYAFCGHWLWLLSSFRGTHKFMDVLNILFYLLVSDNEKLKIGTKIWFLKIAGWHRGIFARIQ